MRRRTVREMFLPGTRKGLRTAVLTVLAMLALLAVAGAVRADGKPQVTRHDARYLDKAVIINLEWQSPNPITFVRVYLGKFKKEVRIDEYENRRNQAGYFGEATVEFTLTPEQHQDIVAYVLQIEDDLRKKSDQIAGKIQLNSPARKDADDAWGRQHLDKFTATPTTGAPGAQPSSDATQGQVPGAVSTPPPGGYGGSPPQGPPATVPAAMSPAATQGIFIESISHNVGGDGRVSIRVTVNDSAGAGPQSIDVWIDGEQSPYRYQPLQIIGLGQQIFQMSVPGRYEGSSSPIVLGKGSYSLRCRAYAANSQSPEFTSPDQLMVGTTWPSAADNTSVTPPDPAPNPTATPDGGRNRP